VEKNIPPNWFTCIAPSMATSIRPLLIIPKLSWLPNVDAPLINVTVSLPALIRSGSSSPGLGYLPIPRIPFSDSSIISVPSGRNAGAARGMPIPRLTYMPSLSSCAARLMMRSRFCEASVEPG
jgi:hypothetical protein